MTDEKKVLVASAPCKMLADGRGEEVKLEWTGIGGLQDVETKTHSADVRYRSTYLSPAISDSNPRRKEHHWTVDDDIKGCATSPSNQHSSINEFP
jgi:hypothetical protein